VCIDMIVRDFEIMIFLNKKVANYLFVKHKNSLNAVLSVVIFHLS